MLSGVSPETLSKIYTSAIMNYQMAPVTGIHRINQCRTPSYSFPSSVIGDPIVIGPGETHFTPWKEIEIALGVYSMNELITSRVPPSSRSSTEESKKFWDGPFTYLSTFLDDLNQLVFRCEAGECVSHNRTNWDPNGHWLCDFKPEQVLFNVMHPYDLHNVKSLGLLDDSYDHSCSLINPEGMSKGTGLFCSRSPTEMCSKVECPSPAPDLTIVLCPTWQQKEAHRLMVIYLGNDEWVKTDWDDGEDEFSQIMGRKKITKRMLDLAYQAGIFAEYMDPGEWYAPIIEGWDRKDDAKVLELIDTKMAEFVDSDPSLSPEDRRTIIRAILKSLPKSDHK